MPNLKDTYAIFSKLAYQNGVKNPTLGYIYDKNLSTDGIDVWYSPSKRETVIAFRGTSNARDMLPDMAIFLGTETTSPRFMKAVQKYLQVKNKYKWYKIVTTGHSLGGALAIFVARRYRRVKAYVFNPGAGLGSLLRGGNIQNIQVFRTQKDIVSLLDRNRTTTERQLAGNAHTVDNFVDLAIA